MLRINQIKLKLGEPISEIPSHIGKALKIKNFQPLSWRIVKESIDARNKPDITFIYTVDFSVENEEKLLKKYSKIKGINIAKVLDEPYRIPEISHKIESRPVVVGFGPCGMFAALILAQAGLRPIVLERGRKVEERTRDVEHFWETGELDVNSNVQFGEGGAGTFSDGKLTTGIKDPRIRKVNEEFIAAGADPSISYKQMPHIGTDVLRVVVKKIREKIIQLGGDIRFESKVTGLQFDEKNQDIIKANEESSTASENMKKRKQLKAVIINGNQTLKCNAAVFALGNSARDTFRMLYSEGVEMTPKPFSVGVRIEHPQIIINEAQYGIDANDTEGRLGAAAYKLSHHCENGRGVYTFCMCPGGVVVGAASEENCVVTNGMSYFARDGENANSALLVGVSHEDFNDPENALAGIEFQEHLESSAYQLAGGGYFAPAQRLGDFLKNTDNSSENSSNSQEYKKESPSKGFTIKPTYRPGVTWTDLNECLPKFITDAMREALPHMGRKIKGFDMDDAVITGVETRSSCPIRITRGTDLQSVSIEGLYPAGEGAGYAGGIMSAAVDGIKIAEAIIANLSALD